MQRTSVSACDLSHQGDISCKGVETNNSGVILKCITCASILTSDNVSRTQLILKQQHERKCIACVLKLMNDACQCVTCVKVKHRVNFSNRPSSKPQHAQKCSSCVQHLINNTGKDGQILIIVSLKTTRFMLGATIGFGGTIKETSSCWFRIWIFCCPRIALSREDFFILIS